MKEQDQRWSKTVPELRNSLTAEQSNLLGEISDAYMAARQGALSWELHRKYGKPAVMAALAGLRGIVCEVEDHQSVSNRYEPTSLGLLLSPKGEIYERRLVKFLEFLEDVFLKQPWSDSPDRNSITSAQVGEFLGLSKDEAFQLYFLVQRLGFSGSCGYSDTEKTWTMQIWREADELPEWPSKTNFLHQRALNFCKPDAPVFLSDRRSFQNLGISGPAEVQFAPPGVIGEDRDQIFLSYSHKDKRFLEQLLIHLKPLVRKGSVTKWSDKQIAAGDEWEAAISAALARTAVAVLLVSPDFLASDFIHEKELGPFLKAAEGGGVRILWVPVRACAWKETPLSKYQSVIAPDKPIAQMKSERDGAWVSVCEQIKKACQQAR